MYCNCAWHIICRKKALVKPLMLYYHTGPFKQIDSSARLVQPTHRGPKTMANKTIPSSATTQPGGSGSNPSQIDSVKKSNICRDFIRNVCSRGSTCKFSHQIPSRGTTYDYTQIHVITFLISVSRPPLFGSKNRHYWKNAITETA